MISPTDTVLVVGASIAGITAAEELVEMGHAGRIVLIDAEARPSYARPPLSKAVLLGTDAPESAFLPEPTGDRIERINGDAAVALDPIARIVRLASGRHVHYDGLVIATGSRARTLADLGCNPAALAERVLRTLDDARRLRDDLSSASSIAIVGGGVLGMELASAARSAGVRATVVTNEPPLLTQCGPFVSELVLRSARAHGVDVRIDPSGVNLVERSGRPAAMLGDAVIEADVVVTAVGDVPNVEWLVDSGIATVPGVVVDSRCRVSDRIVAAGDVAAFGTPARRTPHWSHAVEQSRIAAAALLLGDGAPIYTPRPYFWTDQFDLALKMGGATPFLGMPEVLVGSLDALDALVQWTDEGVPRGALAINRRVPIPRLHSLAGNHLPSAS